MECDRERERELCRDDASDIDRDGNFRRIARVSDLEFESERVASWPP